jgi:DNA mismatch repair protein MSH4
MAYVEEETEVIFRDNSLRIRYRQPADTMGLDRSTITSLELFQNVRNSKGTSSTLFGLLNSTLTPQGRRMIRSTLFQPSTNRDLITERHEAVEELSSNEDLFTEVRASLKRLLHIDVERSIPWVCSETDYGRRAASGLTLGSGCVEHRRAAYPFARWRGSDSRSPPNIDA